MCVRRVNFPVAIAVLVSQSKCVRTCVHLCVLVCMHMAVIHWMHGSVASTHCAAKEELCSTGPGGEPRSAEDLRMQLSQAGAEAAALALAGGS